MKARSNLIAVFAAACLFAVVGVSSQFVDSIEPSEPPSGSVKPADESPSPLPSLPPHKVTTLFDTLSLPYLDEWFGAMSDPGKVENIVDGTHCAMSAAECPHIMVYNMTKGKAAPIEFDQCSATLEPASGRLRKLSDVTIDGLTANRYEQELCPAGKTGAPSVMRHTWDIPGKLRVVATNTTAPLAIDDLKAVIANIKWLD